MKPFGRRYERQITRAAETGDSDLVLDLANKAMRDENIGLARAAYEKAFAMGCARAMVGVGILDLRNHDPEAARAAFKRGIEAGDREGVLSAARFLWDSMVRWDARFGPPVDEISLPLLVGAEMGVGLAALSLFDLNYENARIRGEGKREPYLAEAIRWMNRVFEIGDPDAVRDAVSVLCESELYDQAKEDWERWMQAACNAGSRKACKELAEWYEWSDNSKSRYWKEKAKALKKKKQADDDSRP
jgi:hypothetical protein